MQIEQVELNPFYYYATTVQARYYLKFISHSQMARRMYWLRKEFGVIDSRDTEYNINRGFKRMTIAEIYRLALRLV